jgi:hypothetical protein
MSAVYIITALVALMEELPPPRSKARARSRSAAAIFLIPFELILTASLRAADLDVVLKWDEALADNERKASASRRRDERDFKRIIPC